MDSCSGEEKSQQPQSPVTTGRQLRGRASTTPSWERRRLVLGGERGRDRPVQLTGFPDYNAPQPKF